MATEPSVLVAAVDLGAASGRVIGTRIDRTGIEVTEAHRFINGPVTRGDGLRWDLGHLQSEVKAGLGMLLRAGPVDSIGIDSWAVDHGFIGHDDEILGDPFHYRDSRTHGVLDRVLDDIPAAELYATTGTALLPFNTAFQLVATGADELIEARRLLLIPDLIGWLLTGTEGAEATNASTTQLFGVRTGTWATDLMDRLGIAPDLFPPLRQPGDPAGELLPAVQRDIGADRPVPVTAVGSHDTASAVVAVPARGERFAYISCGTWSLVGVELDRPVTTEASRLAGFTNELGVDGTIRYLRNVMGLWLLQESVRTWTAAGHAIDLDALLADAARCRPFPFVVDPDQPAFLPPGDQHRRLADACRRAGQAPPESPAEVTRGILDSLAVAYRRTLRNAQQLADVDVDVIHIVGGGARNSLLCQLTANACGRPVIAGPVEASALGNALVQGRALGAVKGGLGDLRSLVRVSTVLENYEPSGDITVWDEAERLAFG